VCANDQGATRLDIDADVKHVVGYRFLGKLMLPLARFAEIGTKIETCPCVCK